ncbi:unnamed protein product [Vitrella brassicaformis CCMP3155]|uniref:Uncharacterized protein n=1 Tax=Vitrella brassicaformis (strain CCMP3155) TaxID=1169540 RepID=A0A0G4EEZ6_VITBC|nr:unnamed protein product [Vitrella brassicaformis CCMP3155]|mmetsp:Transcript_2005/g.4431  ORF Transcript_2005/g.4431 Transcript_2005/m.4431 type:complete len:411 (-) Transcript_2005:435-1667(-)|eukprot:CEL94278.1 unnamed protein product [Vitrella brassicaformis CCMP3155]
MVLSFAILSLLLLLLYPLSYLFFQVKLKDTIFVIVPNLFGVYGAAYLELKFPNDSLLSLCTNSNPASVDAWSQALFLMCFPLFLLDLIFTKHDSIMIIHHIACMVNWAVYLAIQWSPLSHSMSPSSPIAWFASGGFIFQIPGFYLECGLFVNHYFRLIRKQRPAYLVPAAVTFLAYFTARVLFLLYCCVVQLRYIEGEWVGKISTEIVFVCNVVWLVRIVRGLVRGFKERGKRRALRGEDESNIETQDSRSGGESETDSSVVNASEEPRTLTKTSRQPRDTVSNANAYPVETAGEGVILGALNQTDRRPLLPHKQQTRHRASINGHLEIESQPASVGHAPASIEVIGATVAQNAAAADGEQQWGSAAAAGGTTEQQRQHMTPFVLMAGRDRPRDAAGGAASGSSAANAPP